MSVLHVTILVQSKNAQVGAFFAAIQFQLLPELLEFLHVQVPLVVVKRDHVTVPFFDVPFRRPIVPFDMERLKFFFNFFF